MTCFTISYVYYQMLNKPDTTETRDYTFETLSEKKLLRETSQVHQFTKS